MSDKPSKLTDKVDELLGRALARKQAAAEAARSDQVDASAEQNPPSEAAAPPVDGTPPDAALVDHAPAEEAPDLDQTDAIADAATQSDESLDETALVEPRIGGHATPMSEKSDAGVGNALARAFFAFFMLFVSVLVFQFGMSVAASQPTDGAAIKLLTAVPFLGGAWHLHFALKALRGAPSGSIKRPP